jgi:tRNA (guanosine-2'-O-)-methyltransferase
MQAVIARRLAALTLVLDNVYDPHNLSAVLRSCDAFGVHDVHVIETYESFDINPKVSQGVERWLALHRWSSYDECFARLRAQGFTILRTSLAPDAASVYDVPLADPLAVVFGNEHRGVNTGLAGLCDGTLTIPMAGFVQSLNVSVAAAVTMAVLAARLRASGRPDVFLAPERQQAEYERWVERQASLQPAAHVAAHDHGRNSDAGPSVDA